MWLIYFLHRRAASADECGCDKLDFAAAKVLNKEGLDRFVQERTVIAALNDRLVGLIELVRSNTANDASALHSALCCVFKSVPF